MPVPVVAMATEGGNVCICRTVIMREKSTNLMQLQYNAVVSQSYSFIYQCVFLIITFLIHLISAEEVMFSPLSVVWMVD